jgi:Plasma-membrane choline transporter
MSHIPIVQGVAVDPDGQYQQPHQQHSKYSSSSGDYNNNYGDASSPGVAPSAPYYGGDGDGDEAHVVTADELRALRQNPRKKFQDVIWAVLFWAHLVVMVVVISIGLSSAGQAGVYSSDSAGVLFCVGVTGLVAVGLSIIALSFMMNNTETLVQAALIFSVACSGIVAILGFMAGDLLMGIVGTISFFVGICYARIVWPRIPFAAANLHTALTAVRCNLGLTVVSYGFTGLAFMWTIFWFLGLSDSLANSKGAVVFLLFVSFYWVQQVLQNTMHVTTAGVIGTWWFVPQEANSFWSPALTDSFVRATTYSFGSICFGSLIVAVVQALRALEHYLRGNDDYSAMVCIIQCILACIESIVEYFNRWAYVYVGLYGFSYLEAGRNVIQLFQNKGWTAIISDDLCDNVLFMISVAIGLASGLVGLIIGSLDSSMFADLGFDSSAGPAFFIGLMTGFIFSSIIMSVVGSAVNTVIVCYAEAPAEFQMNHPQLAAQMRASWMEAWPGIVT